MLNDRKIVVDQLKQIYKGSILSFKDFSTEKATLCGAHTRHTLPSASVFPLSDHFAMNSSREIAGKVGDVF